MKNWSKIFLLLALFFVLGCKTNTENKNETVNQPEFGHPVDDPKLPLEGRAKRQTRFKLGIPANENFKVKIYHAYLNADNQSDAIITINRLDYAKSYAKEKKTEEIQAPNGYIGNFNYIMVYDGGTNQLSIPVPIPSSAMKPLDVDFIYLVSDSYQTPVISYRTRDAQFSNVYNIDDGSLNEIFKMTDYLNVGKPNQQAFAYEIEDEGTFSTVKDLKVFKGDFVNSAVIAKNLFTSEKPIIKKTKVLEKVWYYDPKRAGYVTPQK